MNHRRAILIPARPRDYPLGVSRARRHGKVWPIKPSAQLLMGIIAELSMWDAIYREQRDFEASCLALPAHLLGPSEHPNYDAARIESAQ